MLNVSFQAIASDTLYSKGKGKGQKRTIVKPDTEPETEQQQIPKRSCSSDRKLSMPLKTVEVPKEVPKSPGEASPEFKRLVVKQLIKKRKVRVAKRK